jgi:capsular polysaccharide biosynthesis protein
LEATVQLTIMRKLRGATDRLVSFAIRRELISPHQVGYRQLSTIGIREYCERTGELYQAHSAARIINCPLPVNIPNRNSLSRECGRYERSFFDVPEFKVETSFSATVHDCRILRTRNEWGDDFYSIITPDDKQLAFSGTNFQPEHAALLRRGAVTRNIDEATWITPHSTRNHYMWLYNHLTRVMLAEHLGLQGSILFPEKSLLSPVKLATLDRLGYQAPHFVDADDEVLHVKRLHLMEADGFDPWLLGRLRERLVGEAPPLPAKRIYVSREKCHYRKLKNEAELMPELEQRGFERIFLEDLTLVEQIQTLHSAEVVLGAHGAGFANLLFCRPATKVIEIQDPEDPNPHFYALAALLGLNYNLLLGDVKPTDEPHFRDIAIESNCLREVL